MLKTASKFIHNWQWYPSWKCCNIDQKHGSDFGILLWCHLTPQRKTEIWAHNYRPSGVQLPQSYLEKFVCTNLFVPSHFWTTCTKFDTCCWRYVVTCGPSNEQHAGLGAWPKTRHANTIFLHLQLACIPQTLHGDKIRRGYQKGAIAFRSNV